MSTNISVKPSQSPGSMVIKAAGSPCNCGCDDACGLERVKFFPRQLLGADDLNSEQRYFKEKLRRHNRYLHGWGVVCGCEVRPAPTANKPYQVLVCPGYVITPEGDEILIGCPALFDLATCMVSSDDPCAFARPCPPVTSSTPLRQKIYLTVCYKECEVRPVRLAPVGCACDDAQCDYSRIRDAYEFDCLDSLPATHGRPGYDCNALCTGAICPCPPCPQDNCVVLATIRLETSVKPFLPAGVDTATLATSYMVSANAPLQIDNHTDRQLLYSTTMLQAMAMCQCEPVTDPPQIIVDGTGSVGAVSGVLVDISDPLPGAQIFYTVDGTDPTTASTPYGGEFAFANFVGNQDGLVKAIAVAPGHRASPIVSAVVPHP